MNRIDLNGVWQFKAIDAPGTLPAKHKRAAEWMPATVPGTVHTDLLANNLIPDPFVRMNELDVQWVESQQWLYRKEFNVTEDIRSGNRVDLIAEGLDTYARITINGKHVGESSNMFIGHRFNVKKFLKPGTNVIEMLFDSPIVRPKRLEEKHGSLQVALEPHRVYVRKAQYSYGWDWGPKLTTSGIWKSIVLESCSHAVLRNPHIKIVSTTLKKAVIHCSADVEGLERGPFKVQVSLTGEGSRAEDDSPVRSGKISFRLTLPNPRLWWPNGYGEQPIYSATFVLFENGVEVDSLQVPFAIRTVRLIQEKDKAGRSFILEVNGVKIFCKGANWIPCDSFIPRIPALTYERLLTLAKEANMNMIRVWGGGIYEQNAFYDLCDKLGLMVWQDFMFACGEYPEQPWFLRAVEQEAVTVVQRLCNHPSVVLWCGNNECEWLYCTNNPGKTPDDMTGARIFRDVLPRAVRKFDGTRPYWRSSPFGRGLPNDEASGNHHQWFVWGAWKNYRDYEKDHARFVTEFGFQSMPDQATLASVTIPSDLHPQSRVLEHHNKLEEGTERLIRFQAAHFRLGHDFDDFIYKSQLVQAEALKTAVEHWRRRKFATAGALFWQLNDCWPVSSWSVVDSALRPKAAYFYARRFFAPVLVSFKKVGEHIEVWGTNDLNAPVAGDLDISLRTFAGAPVWSQNVKVKLPRNSSRILTRLDKSQHGQEDPPRSYFLATLKSDSMILSENRLFFVEPKHMQGETPTIRTDLKELNKQTYELVLQAKTFARNVRISVDGDSVDLEDNYFDLDAGKEKRIVLRSRGSTGIASNRISIRSLW